MNRERMDSRLSKLYRDSVETRRRRVEEALELAPGTLDQLDAGLSVEVADQLVENVIGLFPLPFAIATNFQIDGRDLLIPMVVEEPSVVAAASNAARMVRAGGGFTTSATDPITIAQIELRDVPDPAKATGFLKKHESRIGAECDAILASLVKRGGGFRGMECRRLRDEKRLVVHLHIDCRDAMGANAVNTVAEAVSGTIVGMTGGTVGLRILSNLADQRMVKASCTIPTDALLRGERDGATVRDGIVATSQFAILDPYRAATHNKGIMNGIDAVVLATANDWRAVEAGAHAYAARSGTYSPLSVWTTSPTGELVGELELPLSVGIVGGATKIHPTAKLACELLRLERATDLARIAAAVGLAQNLGAISALASEGIQQGHMALHNRSRDLQSKD